MKFFHDYIVRLTAFILMISFTQLKSQVVNVAGPCDFGNGSAALNPAPFNVNNFSSTGNLTIQSGIYNFQSFNLNAGHTLTITGNQPVIIRCTGTANIQGRIIAAGAPGTSVDPTTTNSVGPANAAGGIANNGGGQNGGNGGDGNGLGVTDGGSFINLSGFEGGGKAAASGCGGAIPFGSGGGGSFASQGGATIIACGNNTPVSSFIYGDVGFTIVHAGTNLLGGSGGGGGTYSILSGTVKGGGGGSGGGAFAIVANNIIIGNAALLSVKGGGGGSGRLSGGSGAHYGSGGGGGSGGSILLLYNTISALPAVNTNATTTLTSGIDISGGTGGLSVLGNAGQTGGFGRFLAQTCGAGSNQAPTITTQPTNLTACLNDQNVKLTVAATGIPAPTYQWRKNGTNIPGATADTYTFSNILLSDAGTYDVVVSNVAGNVTSAVVTVTVVFPPLAPGIQHKP